MAIEIGTSKIWKVHIDIYGIKLIVADDMTNLIATVVAMHPGAKVTEISLQNEVYGDKKALK